MDIPTMPPGLSGYRNTRGRCAAALLVIALVMLACGVPPSLPNAPAGALAFDVQITGAYTDTNVTGPVRMLVSVWSAMGSEVMLSGGQRLSCAGTSDPNEARGPWTYAQFIVPRQGAGGSYSCVYMDEHGQRSTLTIAMPPVPLAITSPVAGTRVSIPRSTGAQTTLAIHYSFPDPPGFTVPAPGSYQPFPPGSAVPPPGSIDVFPSAAFPTHLEPSFATLIMMIGCGPIPLAPDSPDSSPCYSHESRAQLASGVYTLLDTDFDWVVPGPGYMLLTYGMQWQLPTAVFGPVRIRTEDTTAIPITWTAPA